jgi:hypothetical protein
VSWKIQKVAGGHVVTWDGKTWGMEPATLDWCRGYVARLKVRYPGGGEWLVNYESSPRTRGGPWRWTAPDGSTDVIHTGRLADAKAVLRHSLGRKTLPRGIVWNLEEGP